MTSLPVATAAVINIDIDGRNYRFSPFVQKDFAEFVAWIQNRYIEVHTRNLDRAPEEHREAILTSAYDKAALITINSPAAINEMPTLDGATMLTWLSLRHEDKSITLEEVGELLSDEGKLDRMLVILERLVASGEVSIRKKKPSKPPANRAKLIQRKREKKRRKKRKRRQK